MNKNNLLILGAASEIGMQLLRSSGNQYDTVYCQYHSSPDGLEQLGRECGLNLQLIQADFADEASTNAFAEVLKALPVTHMLHLVARPVVYQRFPKLKWADFQEDMDVQLRSAYATLDAILPRMSKNKYGKIAFVLTSSLENVPPKYLSNYITAKYALYGLMKALAVEYAGKGVTINAVSPSMMETKFLNGISRFTIEESAQKAPLGRNASVRDVIPMVELLLSDASEYITGQNILISGGNIL